MTALLLSFSWLIQVHILYKGVNVGFIGRGEGDNSGNIPVHLPRTSRATIAIIRFVKGVCRAYSQSIAMN